MNLAKGVIEIVAPIFSDVLFKERLLLRFVDLKVVSNRNSYEFCLVASEDTADYRLEVTDAHLKKKS